MKSDAYETHASRRDCIDCRRRPQSGILADIDARNLGEGSALKLPRGPNAPTELGGLFVTPYRE